MVINNISVKVNDLRGTIEQSVKRVLDRGQFILGPEVKSFETNFKNYIGVPFCSTVGNGTDAIELALRALGIKAGDHVATVANAGFFTSLALNSIGALPFYLDVDLETSLVSLSEIKRAIHAEVKAIVITHLYGRAIPYISEIIDLCEAANIFVLEDCAQAHGALIHDRKVGSFGNVATFSFYPTKNLGALGDGGAIVCKNEKLAATIEKLRQYGWGSKYCIEISGARNSRMDEIQAAILNDFLPHLDDWNQQRRDIATQYSKLISHSLVNVRPLSGKDDVVHLYVIRCKKRELLRRHLENQMIATDIHYPIPDYRQPSFEGKFNNPLPNTEQLSEEILTLPCYPGMTKQEVQEVICAVNSWADHS